jgi:multimeric flavodoxin WrbA
LRKVTAFVGSARKKHTYQAARKFLDSLEALGGVETDLVRLSDYAVGTCLGCKRCFTSGRDACPLKDDRDVLIGKMMASDGVVIATPNYSFQVSALTKIFLDRLGFVFHRPRFFGRAFTSIVSQGIYAGQKIERYLDFVGAGLGFNTVKGTYFTAFEPMTAKEEQKLERALADQVKRFHERMMKPAYPAPTLFRLMAFRMSRTSIRLELDESSYDYRHYRDQGWFESDYYYPTRLGPLKRLAGGLFDSIQAARTRNKKR